MTKKDFAAIAAAIEETRSLFPGETSEHGEAYTLAIDTVAKRIANVLGDSNPRFDRERFLAACGVI